MAAKRRDRDGNPIDEVTRPIWEQGEVTGIPPGGAQRDPELTRPAGRGGGMEGYDATTRLAGGADREDIPTVPASDREDRYAVPTRPVDAGREDAGEGRTVVYSDLGPMSDPPVGWLVIVRGPGKGRVATLKGGVNFIGRGRDNRVSLGYGDMRISQSRHCSIVYDDENRAFHIQHVDGKNLTYVDNEPVLSPRLLEAFARVRMGETVLSFVPFCGPGFSWADESADR